ncbi:MAG: DUF2344 domain-containing protein [Aminivibrio sp.]|jgi:hypothetical protein
MIRVRMTFSKRGRACFIPHIAIPPLLTRSGTRAGLEFDLTKGFSPRPRISLGPELSVGVPALAEPFDVWLTGYDDDVPHRWSRCLPPGFSITGAAMIDAPPGTEEARSIGRRKLAASSLLALRDGDSSALETALGELLEGGKILEFCRPCGLPSAFFRVISKDPARMGPGTLVRALAARGVIEGWPDIFILREAVGLLASSPEDGEIRVEPLVPALQERKKP